MPSQTVSCKQSVVCLRIIIIVVSQPLPTEHWDQFSNPAVKTSNPRSRAIKPRQGDTVQELFASDYDSVATYCEGGKEKTELDRSDST